MTNISLTKIKTRRTLIVAVVVLLNLLAAGLTSAQSSFCSGVEGRRETYLPISGTLRTNIFDSRANPNSDNHEVQLRGTLHYRRAAGEVLKNRPVLIFNHGHEQKRGEACTIVEYFTAQGWVVFTPLRRGHYIDVNDDGDGDDTVDIRSTGIYIDDFVDKCSRSQTEAEDDHYLTHLYRGSGFCRPGAPTDPVERRSAVELAYLSEQRIDVRDAITYLKALPAISTEAITHPWKLIDAKRIVVLGHSYGGALTVFANTVDYGQSVAIDISGGELSWNNDDEPYWRIDLMAAMMDRKRPIYFLQPRNAKYLTPTKELFAIAVDKTYRSQAAIFPNSACNARTPAPDRFETFPPCNEPDPDPEDKQIHSTFIGHEEQIAKWGPSVIEFAKRNPR